jgi:monoamine oxidase
MRWTFSRRDFVRTSGMAALGAGISMPVRRHRRVRCDIAIVGAGLSGLCAGHELMKLGLTSLVVLDARTQVGGRIFDQRPASGVVVEGGGEWVGPTQTAVLALLSELGLSTFTTYDQGRDLVALGGRLVEPDGTADAEIHAAGDELDALSRSVPLDTPWLASGGTELDRLSLGDWLRRKGFSPTTRLVFDKITWATLGAVADDISLLYFLFYIHSAGGLEQRTGTLGAAQDSRVVGGPQQMATRLAERLAHRVLLGHAVRSIGQNVRGATIEADGLTVRARKVIIAMMPRDTGRIAYAPELSPRRQALAVNWPAAKVFKGNVLYREPFWRGLGLSGQVSNYGAIYSVFDNSPPSGEPGILEVFSHSGMLPPRREDRLAHIVGELARYFGPEALRPTGYVEKDWGDEKWISGCVSPLPPGFLTAFGPALKAPAGHIHWASAETADVWNGKFDGAVRAALQAARDVVGLL